MADPVRIGEAARRSGFTVKALRYYDLHGLLPPAARSASGYRLYDAVDLHRLEFIRQAKALGLALDEIRQLVDAARTQDATARPRLRRVLDGHIAHITSQITMLARLRRETQATSALPSPLPATRRWLLLLPARGRAGFTGTNGAYAARRRPWAEGSGGLSKEPNGTGRRLPLELLAAAFLFNLGQGVLRPSLPLFLQEMFAANYRMVTMIPVVFGAGRWIANLPTAYLLDRIGRRALTVGGLLVVAASDLACVAIRIYSVFLGFRGVAGAGWAMFGTIATTTMVDRSATERRGQRVSLLLMTETLGLLLGSAAGGWLYEGLGVASPFVFEAGCMVGAALAVIAYRTSALDTDYTAPASAQMERRVGAVLRVPVVLLMSLTNAALTAIQTGVVVFLFPLYVVEYAGLRPSALGWIVSLNILGRLVGLWFGGKLSDRCGRLAVLVPGLLGYGVLLTALAILAHPVLLAPWSLFLGASGGLVAGLPTVIIGDRVAAPLRAMAIGWFRTITDGGFLVGPMVMGVLADRFGLVAPFVAAGALTGVLAGACFLDREPT